jgi:hypothetical protein
MAVFMPTADFPFLFTEELFTQHDSHDKNPDQ